MIHFFRTILRNAFKAIISSFSSCIPFKKMLLVGYLKETSGWISKGEEKTIRIPSTHDLSYVIGYAIEKELERLHIKKVKNYTKLGYTITKEEKNESNGFINHLITYKIYIQ